MPPVLPTSVSSGIDTELGAAVVVRALAVELLGLKPSTAFAISASLVRNSRWAAIAFCSSVTVRARSVAPAARRTSWTGLSEPLARLAVDRQLLRDVHDLGLRVRVGAARISSRTAPSGPQPQRTSAASAPRRLAASTAAPRSISV
jgi:hypothetical protein